MGAHFELESGGQYQWNTHLQERLELYPNYPKEFKDLMMQADSYTISYKIKASVREIEQLESSLQRECSRHGCKYEDLLNSFRKYEETLKQS